MNLPSGTARQSGGMAIGQLQCIARVRDGLMGFADDNAVDAYPPRQNPLFGAVFRRVRMLPQQPIQKGAGVSTPLHKYNHVCGEGFLAQTRRERRAYLLYWK